MGGTWRPSMWAHPLVVATLAVCTGLGMIAVTELAAAAYHLVYLPVVVVV